MEIFEIAWTKCTSSMSPDLCAVVVEKLPIERQQSWRRWRMRPASQAHPRRALVLDLHPSVVARFFLLFSVVPAVAYDMEMDPFKI